MKHTRIIVTRYGGPDALQVIEEERPDCDRMAWRTDVRAWGPGQKIGTRAVDQRDQGE